MTLIATASNGNGDLVVCADKRGAIFDKHIGYYVKGDSEEKLFPFSGGVVVGLSGEASLVSDIIPRASYELKETRQVRAHNAGLSQGAKAAVIRDNEERGLYEDEYGIDACAFLADRLNAHFGKWFGKREGAGTNKWPDVEITYCQWHHKPLGPRIVKLFSRDGFCPRGVSGQYAFSGMYRYAHGLCERVYDSSMSIEELKLLMAFLVTESARTDPTIGPSIDMFVLASAGTPERITDSEIAKINRSNQLMGDTLRQYIRSSMGSIQAQIRERGGLMG